jgi:hypothetical protein
MGPLYRSTSGGAAAKKNSSEHITIPGDQIDVSKQTTAGNKPIQPSKLKRILSQFPKFFERDNARHERLRLAIHQLGTPKVPLDAAASDRILNASNLILKDAKGDLGIISDVAYKLEEIGVADKQQDPEGQLEYIGIGRAIRKNPGSSDISKTPKKERLRAFQDLITKGHHPMVTCRIFTQKNLYSLEESEVPEIYRTLIEEAKKRGKNHVFIRFMANKLALGLGGEQGRLVADFLGVPFYDRRTGAFHSAPGGDEGELGSHNPGGNSNDGTEVRKVLMELRGNDSDAAKKHAQEIIMAFASDGDADKLIEAMTHARSFLTQNQQDGTSGAGLVA